MKLNMFYPFQDMQRVTAKKKCQTYNIKQLEEKTQYSQRIIGKRVE